MGIDPITHKPFSQILSDYGNISGLSNPRNQIASFNKNLNSNLITKPEPSFVLTSSNNVILKQENSWELLPQFQATSHELVQPHLFNEVSSSSSSSSSTSVAQSQPPLTPSSPSLWSEFLLGDPLVYVDFQQQQQQKQDSLGAISSTSKQIDMLFQGKFASGNEDFGWYDQRGIYGDASSSSASSFVDGILDKDREMGSQFPEILDPFF